MSTSNDQEAVSGPTRALQETYLNSLQARQNYLDVVTGGAASNTTKEAAHADLHSTTLKWFEAIRPYLEEYDDLEYFWDEVELWPVGYKQVEGVFCAFCEDGFERSDELRPGVMCPNCGEGVLEPREFVKTNETGEPEYEYATGLKTLDGHEGRTQTVTREVNMTCRTRTMTKEVPIRLKPKRLLRACHEIDKAADRLDLLADVAKNVPQTEITTETIEGFQEQIKKIVEEAEAGVEEATGVGDE